MQKSLFYLLVAGLLFSCQAQQENNTEESIPKEPESLACNVCLEEIPESVASSQEGDEYTQHFCGIDCYSVWKNQPNKASVK